MGDAVVYPKMASVRRAAEQFGCTAFFVRKLCSENKIRYTIVSSRRWLVNMDSLAQFFEQGAAPAEQPAAVVNGIRRIAP